MPTGASKEPMTYSRRGSQTPTKQGMTRTETSCTKAWSSTALAMVRTRHEPKDRKRKHIGIIPHLLLSIVYVALHALLNLVQAVVLNVAINSFNKALLTIMISNQFIEIKTSVFKRFEKNNLFQMSCSDARERFHYLVLLLVVGIRNLTEYDWNFSTAWKAFAPFAALVVGSELDLKWLLTGLISSGSQMALRLLVRWVCSGLLLALKWR